MFVAQCPICQGKTFSQFLRCTDHTVSHETFQLVKCDSCGLVITSPHPDQGALTNYYLSDDYISHSNRSLTLLDKIYKISRSFTVRWKVDLIQSNLHPEAQEKLKLLDFGCGTGEFLQAAKQKGFEVAGVEPSAVARNQAAALTERPIHADLKPVSDSFRVITLWHVLEHLPDLNQILSQLYQRLEKNGIIFIAVPNHQSLDAITYKNHWAGYDVPRHLWHFNKETMQKLLRNHALTVEKVLPMNLDAFYVSLLSEKYVKGKNTAGGMMCAFLRGLKSNLAAKKTTEYSSLIYLARK